jgi:WD40 repeat protein
MVLRGHQNVVTFAAFSPDGARIVTASWDKTARIWDAAAGKELVVLRGHEDQVLSAAFNADGTRIATASRDDSARVWDAASGHEITSFREPPVGGISGALEGEGLNSVAFKPDGTRIVTGSVDATARVWDVHFATMSTPNLMEDVCQRRLRGLTTLTRDEMRLAGYADDVPLADVCAGIGQPASP